MKILFSLLTLLPLGALAAMDHDQMNHDTMNHMEAPMPQTAHQKNMKMPAESHSDMMHHANLKGRATPSAQAYAHINHTMHEGMMIEFTGNPDIDFLKGMIPHHQGAVDMAQVQLSMGNDGLLKSFTSKIIRDQEREIRFMKRRLVALESADHGDHEGGNRSSVRAFKQMNGLMHKQMDITYTGNADIDFVTGMIPHHQGAVDMARVVLEYGKDANVRNLAYEIISTQESEISWMKRWLHRLRLIQSIKRW